MVEEDEVVAYRVLDEGINSFHAQKVSGGEPTWLSKLQARYFTETEALRAVVIKLETELDKARAWVAICYRRKGGVDAAERILIGQLLLRLDAIKARLAREE